MSFAVFFKRAIANLYCHWPPLVEFMTRSGVKLKSTTTNPIPERFLRCNWNSPSPISGPGVRAAAASMVAAVQGVLWPRQLQQGQHLPCHPTPPPTTTTWTTASAAARQEVQSVPACLCPQEEPALQGAFQFNLHLKDGRSCILMRRSVFSILKSLS